MHDYREAFNETQLKKVDQFKYYNNVDNNLDPEFMKYKKSTKSVKNVWKKTYGFPYVRVNSWDGTVPWEVSNTTECFKKCASYVSSYYKRYKV